MTVQLSNEGRVPQLEAQITDAESAWRVCLFKSNLTYDASYAYNGSDEATFSAYTRQTIDFGSASLDGSNHAVATSAQVVFSHNGGATSNSIYAWGVIHNATNKLRFCDYLRDPVSGDPVVKTMAASGDSIGITFTLKEKPTA